MRNRSMSLKAYQMLKHITKTAPPVYFGLLAVNKVTNVTPSTKPATSPVANLWIVPHFMERSSTGSWVMQFHAQTHSLSHCTQERPINSLLHLVNNSFIHIHSFNNGFIYRAVTTELCSQGRLNANHVYVG